MMPFKDSIIDLVERCLRFREIFYFSSIYIEDTKTISIIFFLFRLCVGGVVLKTGKTK